MGQITQKVHSARGHVVHEPLLCPDLMSLPPKSCLGFHPHSSPPGMWQAAFSRLLQETWDILWVIAAELWVLEPFRAEEPELGEVWLGNGCEVLRVMSGQCFGMAEQGRSVPLSLLPGGGQVHRDLAGSSPQRSVGAPCGSDGTEPCRDGRNLPRTLANPC